jgi:hypothetical protein
VTRLCFDGLDLDPDYDEEAPEEGGEVIRLNHTIQINSFPKAAGNYDDEPGYDDDDYFAAQPDWPDAEGYYMVLFHLAPPAHQHRQDDSGQLQVPGFPGPTGLNDREVTRPSLSF